MKMGLQIPNFTWPGGPDQIGSKLAEIARTADEVGFASLWMMDHFFHSGGLSRLRMGSDGIIATR